MGYLINWLHTRSDPSTSRCLCFLIMLRKLTTQSAKTAWTMCSYVFQEGPWRDTVIRIGYDPRQDPQAVMYASRFITLAKKTAQSLQGIRLLPYAMSEIRPSVLLSSKVVAHKQSRKETRACNELTSSVDILMFSVAHIHLTARRRGLLVPSNFVISQTRLYEATLMTLVTGSTRAQ